MSRHGDGATSPSVNVEFVRVRTYAPAGGAVSRQPVVRSHGVWQESCLHRAGRRVAYCASSSALAERPVSVTSRQSEGDEEPVLSQQRSEHCSPARELDRRSRASALAVSGRASQSFDINASKLSKKSLVSSHRRLKLCEHFGLTNR